MARGRGFVGPSPLSSSHLSGPSACAGTPAGRAGSGGAGPTDLIAGCTAVDRDPSLAAAPPLRPGCRSVAARIVRDDGGVERARRCAVIRNDWVAAGRIDGGDGRVDFGLTARPDDGGAGLPSLAGQSCFCYGDLLLLGGQIGALRVGQAAVGLPGR